MKLRDYQEEAVAAIYQYFSVVSDGHPLVVMPTGSGKSVVIGEFIRSVLDQWPDQRILVLTHVKELIQQNHDKLKALWPEAPAGIHSAGLKRRDTHHPVLFGGIQSIYKRAPQLGRVDLVLIDECHLVPKDGEGQYRSFLADLAKFNPYMKVVGFTATPFRLKGGHLIKGEGRIFTHICYDTDILRLIKDGYLSQLRPKHMHTQIDTSTVQVRGGEFVAHQLAQVADQNDVTQAALDEVFAQAGGRKKWLFFCTSVAHAFHVAEALRERGISCGTVVGSTPRQERDDTLAAFKAGEIRALTNCDVLTTGFDAPDIDLIALLRPTASPGLYIQIMGRGMRIAEGKKDCLVLDFGGNVLRHGPINNVNPPREGRGGGSGPPMKFCPMCRAPAPAAAMECEDCGYKWPCNVPQLDTTASTLDIIDWGDNPNTPKWVVVDEVTYQRHSKPGGTDSMRVTYYCGMASYSEWICFEHQGYARDKAVTWWHHAHANGNGTGQLAPRSIEAALERAVDELRTPSKIRVKKNGKYWEIVKHEYGDPEDGVRAPARIIGSPQQTPLGRLGDFAAHL